MSSRVRLLPALIGAAGVLMVLRLGAMASAAEEAKPAEAAETHAAEPAAEAVAAHGDAPKETKTAEAAPAAVAAPEPAPSGIAQAQTKGEAQVLENLSERRAALDARERDLSMREQLLDVTEKRVTERVAELKDLETRLNALLTQRDEQEEAQLASLVKTYENMKPTDAAKIFNKLDRSVLLSVASRMKPAKIGGVMAAMEPARAQELTVMLAKRMSVAKPVAAVSPAPAPAPVPVAASAPVEAPAAAPAEHPQAAHPPAAPAEAPHG